MPRFYDVDAGRVLLDGVDVRDVKVHELRRSVGIVFEDTFLFSDTVRDNIAFADPQAAMDDVAARRPPRRRRRVHRRPARRLRDRHRRARASPCRAGSVSGSRSPGRSWPTRRVLILDDATSSVDPTKEHEIRAALREVMAGRTTLIIAHRPATIALADRVVLLDGGRVVAEGTHEELLASSERYREVLAQAAAIEAAVTVEPVQ